MAAVLVASRPLGLKGTAFLAAVLSVMNSSRCSGEAYLISGDHLHEHSICCSIC